MEAINWQHWTEGDPELTLALEQELKPFALQDVDFGEQVIGNILDPDLLFASFAMLFGFRGPDYAPNTGIGGGDWSTGRGPQNAMEQAAWDKVLADPWTGRQLPLELSDPRWPAEGGWVKMERKVNGVKIHWNLNKLTGEIDDMKIK